MLSGRLASRRENTIQEPTINVTPLIDVVFVLLISFIIIAPLLEQDRVELASGGGTPTHRQVEASSPITIHVLQNNTIMIGKRPVLLSQLPAILSGLKERYPQAKPQLFHDRRAAFGTYQEIKNALEVAGFSELDILLRPS